MEVFQILTNVLYIFYVLDITFLSISVGLDKFNVSFQISSLIFYEYWSLKSDKFCEVNSTEMLQDLSLKGKNSLKSKNIKGKHSLSCKTWKFN